MSATTVKSDTLLDVRDLRVAYREDRRIVPIVDGVSFQLRRGEALGLAGESGCGKTTTALALLGLLPSGLRRIGGEMTINSKRGVMLLHRRTPTGWRDMRWADRVDGLPGRDERARPGHAHRPADRRGDRPARSRHAIPINVSPSCSSASASRRRGASSTRTSSPAGCGSAS